jgi:hypothetical protein
MGRLKPGATYTYEYEGDVVYAREAGQERFVIGWRYIPIPTTVQPPQPNDRQTQHSQ